MRYFYRDEVQVQAHKEKLLHLNRFATSHFPIRTLLANCKLGHDIYWDNSVFIFLALTVGE